MASTMFSMFRRTLTTSTSKLVKTAELAQASSAPLAVREKRAEILQNADKVKKPLTYAQRRRLVRPPVKANESRSRIRGIEMVRDSTGKEVPKILGERIYLPNLIFRLVRNHTPPGEAYNPYEATFRVAQSVTKTDIRSYLLTVYGVETTYIRTDNYLAKVEDNAVRQRDHKKGRSAFKRAVVGLKEPFYYPQAVEDMNGRERWLREAEVEDTFRTKEIKQLNRDLLVKLTQKTGDKWSQRGEKWETRAQILKNVWQRKEERERKLRETADVLRSLRKEGKLSSIQQMDS